MGKLLFIYERNMPTVALTTKGFERLSQGENFTVKAKKLSDVKHNDIDDSDVVMFIRPDNVYSPKVAKCAHESGTTVITFCDDDLLHIDSASMPVVPWRKRGLINTLGQSDSIVSSSRYILDKYCPLTFGKKDAVIDTLVLEEDFAPAERNNDVVKLVYAASPAHVSLFEKYIREAFIRIAKQYGKKISITFVGLRPELDEIKDVTNIAFKTGMPLEGYRKYMAEQQFDIGLAPLNSDNFSKCKYFNKYLEYTMSGVMGLYSNTEPYTYVVKNKKNGLLVDDGHWYEAIKLAVDDAELRKICVENAREHVRNNFRKDQIIVKLKEDIPELFETGRKRKACKSFVVWKMQYYFYRILDYIYLIIYYQHHGGIKRLTNKVVIHFRERGTSK